LGLDYNKGELLMMKLKYLFLIFTSLLIANAYGQDYLGGGNAGYFDATDMAQYFTDPIFTPISTGAQQQSWMYYPYFGGEFFRDYAKPYQFRPGTYAGPYGVYLFNPEPYYSDFRLKSLAEMNWEPFQKSNWSETANYAKTRSSIRVYQNGAWILP
jgi:hypothetical protein